MKIIGIYAHYTTTTMEQAQASAFHFKTLIK